LVREIKYTCFETTFEQEESDDDVEHVFAVEKKRQDAENEKPGGVGGGHKIGVWTRDEHTSNIHGQIRAKRRPQHKHVKRHNRSENLTHLEMKTQNKTKQKSDDLCRRVSEGKEHSGGSECACDGDVEQLLARVVERNAKQHQMNGEQQSKRRQPRGSKANTGLCLK
jgi:hypothetical protein